MSSSLHQKLFSAADSLRSKMDASEYKNYLLGLIFYKFLSEKTLSEVVNILEVNLDEYDTTTKRTELYVEYYENEDYKEVIIDNLVTLNGFYIKPEYLFNTLADKAKVNTFQIDDLTQAFTTLSTEFDQFKELFNDIDLRSNKLGQNDQQRNLTISEVIKKLDEVDVIGHEGDIIGDAYEYLIGQFASEAGKKAGEFYTPSQVSDMMARIVTIGQEEHKGFTVYDPAMGSGSLMLNIRKYLKYKQYISFHGQELNTTTYNLAKMNLILHGVPTERMRLKNGDSLNLDWPTDEPYMFDAVVMNPPYSAKWSSDDTFMDDSRFNKYGRLAPKSKADFAFLLHGFYHLKETGTMAIVLPHGVLFRRAAEETIRKKLLEDGSIYAVIGMPANLFFGTSIPTTVIILKKDRPSRDVFFIDASKEFVKEKNQNKLTQENIDKIVDAYIHRKDIEKYAHLASFEEIIENDYNLNIPRYVDTFEEEEVIPLNEIGKDLINIDKELEEANNELKEMMSELVGTNKAADKELKEFMTQLFGGDSND